MVDARARLDGALRDAAGDMARCGFEPAEVEAVSAALRNAAAYSSQPEWLDMYRAIQEGEDLSPQFGWFRTAVSQSRYGWDATLQRYNRDADLRLSRVEFPGDDTDMARLDRDHDGFLSREDFDLAAAPQVPSPGRAFFLKADRDGNGKVSREEFDRFFTAADRDGLGFLSGTDLETILPASMAHGQPPDERPSRDMLLRGLFRQEFGSLQSGPNLDDRAPDFRLRTNDGKTQVSLSGMIGPRPLVLIFGNFTCGPFRYHAGNLEKLFRRYRERANFLMIYVRETHPADGWRMQSNETIGISAIQPRTWDQRADVARRCGRLLGLGFPMLVDTIDDGVATQYSGMPARLYLIDRMGKIAYKGGRGPYGFKPDELEQALILLLNDVDDRKSKAVEHDGSRGVDGWERRPAVRASQARSTRS
ncbi:Iodothyronine deiodinase [Aquisphaera giovannonii]|uniref:Iodothyronine deiodinase n=2 Tax=Aquisphaera giovannonii TaxID=406548 RepID=A0A5B9W943_9BACT|nr:Iodothyronine deiodinase [Aquisphaera giovannonii]